MNILFANYGDFTANSMNHIAPFANRLTELGHSCIVAVPSNLESASNLEKVYFQPETFQNIIATPNHFPNSKAADILHAWTPREALREFVENYTFQHETKVIIHLEDHEEELITSYYRSSGAELEQNGLPDGFSDWVPALSRPLYWQSLMTLADGVTIIIDSLKKFTCQDTPRLELLPGVDLNEFSPRSRNAAFEERLTLSKGEKVIVYPGGITASNREDVRSLYLAVKILNDKGRKTRLVKTGPTDPTLGASFGFDINTFVTDLGIIPRSDLPNLLSLADICVQPGAPDAFNQFRLPSKLPEFLASAKPVITTKANLGLRLANQENCLLLETGSPEEIAKYCIQILDSPELAKKLSNNGRDFAVEKFELSRNTDGLLEFYERARRQSASHWKPLWKNRPSIIEALPIRINLLEQKESACAISDSAKKLLDHNPISTASMDTNNLDSQIQHLSQENSKLHDKVARMQKSFSWKITSPLRILRRLLIDNNIHSTPKKTVEAEPIASPAEEIKIEQEERIEEVSPPTVEQSEAGPPPAYRNYQDFCSRLEPLIQEYIENFTQRLSSISNPPLISIILPVYNTPEKWLSKAIESVIQQIYPHWELCIADDASPDPDIRKILERYRKSDNRIKVVYREENGHISASSNSAIEIATGAYIALLDHDDLIPPHALARIVDCITENPSAKIIYTDEDKVDENGERSSPHFKSDWNPDLLMGQNFISHFGVYSKNEVDAVQGFRVGFEGAQDWDLALRISERCSASQIVHISEALYHWRSISGSTALDIGEKNYAHEAAGKVIQDALKRRNIDAQLKPVERYYWRVIYPIPDPEPSVSIVIPTRDCFELLKNCIESVREKTTYRNYHFIIIDNGSEQQETLDYLDQLQSEGETILRQDGPFNFNALNNYAISHSNADFVCMLNNDITVIEPEWLSEMVSQASRSTVGAVGGKLLYPHDHVQHAGVIMGIGGVASEAFKKLHVSDDGYIHRAHLVGNYSAVTGACLLFRRSVWKEVDGLKETDVPNAFGDVDFCLRVRKIGYSILFTPFALLYHHESASRGNDLDPGKIDAFSTAVDYMQNTWAETIERDPFYNPNLTLDREDFTLTFPPRGYSTK